MPTPNQGRKEETGHGDDHSTVLKKKSEKIVAEHRVPPVHLIYNIIYVYNTYIYI